MAKEPLSIPELEAARDELRQAKVSVVQVRSNYVNAGAYATGARLGVVAARLSDEILIIERAIERIATAKP